MRWSWKIGTFADIGVYVHVTFLLLLGFVGYNAWAGGGNAAEIAGSLAFILAIFGCVVLHEFGHALTARHFGIKTRDITLLPIGGVARLERIPREPWQEFLVALAGPAVNVVIAAILLPVMIGMGLWSRDLLLNPLGGSLVFQLVLSNVALVLFNMLPAFPMDGGRVLRALLAMKFDYVQATRWAARIGQGMAVLIGLAGIFWLDNPFMALIGVFIWFSAAQEAQQVQVRYALQGILVRNAMITDFRTLAPGESVARAVELLLSGTQEDFPVVEEGRVVGILTRVDLARALAQGGTHWPVERAMRTDFVSVDGSEPVQNVLERLGGSEYQTFPVVHGEQLEGLLTLQHLRELLMVQAALGEQGHPA
ncbi:MAG: site-2 protease family protein [Planctomycetes bacterium]|nr:site-2 protease family protein [Planctomycetota bacterium]